MIPAEKVVQRLKSQIAVCHEIDSDWCSLTVGTCKRILELLGERKVSDDCCEKCRKREVRVWKPPVTCGECRYYFSLEKENVSIHFCNHIHAEVPGGEWYCAGGKRKKTVKLPPEKDGLKEERGETHD